MLCSHNLAQNYVIEGGCFVLHATAVLSQKGVDCMNTSGGEAYHACGGGGSCVFGPDGKLLTKLLKEDEEGLVFADLDFDEILKSKAFLDIHGHYSRPELLWLTADTREKKQVRHYSGNF